MSKQNLTDPAVSRAQQLWRDGQRKESVQVLVRRIAELSREVESLKDRKPGRSFPLLRLALDLIVALIVAAVIVGVAFMYDDAQHKEGYDPAVQEWWSYSAPAADEFMSSLRLSLLMAVTEEPGADSYNFGSSYYILEASDYKDQFEGVSFPFKAKSARDNIKYGMSSYMSFAVGVSKDMEHFAETNEFSAETLQDLEDARAYMRDAAQQIEELTGEDASFLVLEKNE